MLKRITLAVLIYGSLGNTWAEPPAPSPKIIESKPVRMSGTAPGPITLTPDVWLVADCAVECIPRSSQVGTGRVKFTVETGPIKLRGRFATGNGGVETRTFPGPFVYVIEADASGPCEVLLIPKGLKDEKEIVAIALDVALDPIPPPPDLEPHVTSLAAKIKAADTDTDSMKELAAVYRTIAGRITTPAMDKVATGLQWDTLLKDSREQAIGTKIAKSREAIADYFETQIPVKADTKVDAPFRKKASATLIVAAKALEKAAK